MPDSYQVRITLEALSDLEEIFDYIRQSSPQNARTVIERLMDAIDGLQSFPSRFRSPAAVASAAPPCIAA
jgi:plasmid stabilization system protein ParE